MTVRKSVLLAGIAGVLFWFGSPVFSAIYWSVGSTTSAIGPAEACSRRYTNPPGMACNMVSDWGADNGGSARAVGSCFSQAGCTGSVSTIYANRTCMTAPNLYMTSAGSCVSSCPAGTAPNAVGNCLSTSCQAPSSWDDAASGAFVCVAPPCAAGTAFVGVGADTQPKCQGGCSYAISAPAVYGEVTAGVVGVHSRWVASGASCGSADELVAADVTGCPNEVSPDMRAAICGIPAPCESGEFLFSGECVADSAETGCVIVDGEQVCAEAEQNCVVINGKRVCAEVPEGPEDLETYKENGCVWSFAQGAWVCPTDTATKTTTGTTTTETDPVTGNKTTTTVTTIRNNVTGGTTTTTTTVVTDPDGNEISRDVAEQTTGAGGDGGTLVSREPEALGEKPDLDWLRTAQEVKDNLSAQWDAVPLVAAVSSFSDLQLSGVQPVCPEFCLPFWGETLCTTKHCEIWATISGIIAGVLLALYGMTAIRIVLSA